MKKKFSIRSRRAFGKKVAARAKTREDQIRMMIASLFTTLTKDRTFHSILPCQVEGTWVFHAVAANAEFAGEEEFFERLADTKKRLRDEC